jgi:hypothetical protein
MGPYLGFEASDLGLGLLQFPSGLTKFTPKVLHLSLQASFVLGLLWCCLGDGLR